jgi:hypothetical protein
MPETPPVTPDPPYVYRYLDPNAIDNSADKHLSALETIVSAASFETMLYTNSNAMVILEPVDMSATQTPTAISYDVSLSNPSGEVAVKLLNVVFQGHDRHYLVQAYDKLLPTLVNEVGLSTYLKDVFQDNTIMKLLLDAKNYVAPPAQDPAPTPDPPAGP